MQQSAWVNLVPFGGYIVYATATSTATTFLTSSVCDWAWVPPHPEAPYVQQGLRRSTLSIPLETYVKTNIFNFWPKINT